MKETNTLTGKTVLLHTKRANGIQPMVEVVKEDEKTITHRGLFGGTKLRRSSRNRVARVLDPSAPALNAGQYTVKLRSDGNPDFGQYAPVSNPQTVVCDTLEQVQQECRKYIDFWNLGGGNWMTPTVFCGGKPVCKVGYNGRLWEMSGYPNEYRTEMEGGAR